MRRARYDMRQVICPNSSGIGYSSVIARPGYWIAWDEGDGQRFGRVLGRIAESEHFTGAENCAGYIAAVRLTCELTHAYVAWVKPDTVQACYEKPPAALLAWLTGPDWVKSKGDIARIVAMSQHGTLSDHFIGNRDKPEQAYNARPAYVDQFILKG